jgi:hypothetical protein
VRSSLRCEGDVCDGRAATRLVRSFAMGGRLRWEGSDAIGAGDSCDGRVTACFYNGKERGQV